MGNIALTTEQEIAVKGIKEWYGKASKQSCSMTGYAGTGKTFLVNHIIEELELRPHEVAFAAYTGKASLLLKQANKKYSCSTIHRLAYTLDGDSAIPQFKLREKDDLQKIRLIVIDEASMLTKAIYEDLLTFGIPLLLIGDEGQLPAIGESHNVLANPDFRLTEIHRQAKGNPIIHLSMLARQGKQIKPGAYGKQAYVLSKRDVTPDKLDQICLRSEQIICGYNATRQKINNKIRKLKGFKSPLPQIGDKMICTKNSWDRVLQDVSLVNGMTGFVQETKKAEEQKEGIKRDCLEIDFRPDFIEKDSFKNLVLLEDDFKNKKVELTKEEYSKYDRFDWGYCITCHKSQGSQYERVLVVNEVLNSSNHNRWLYTAVTRASDKLILLA